MKNAQEYLLQSFDATQTVDGIEKMINQSKKRLAAIPAGFITDNAGAIGIFEGRYQEASYLHSTYTDYALSIGLEANFAVYSASVQTNLERSTFDSEKTFMSSFQASMNWGTILFDGNNNDIVTLLAGGCPNLLTDLNNIATLADAEQFVSNWGTHLITGVKLGGLLFITAKKEVVAATEKSSLTLQAKGAYNGMVSISTAISIATASGSNSDMENFERTCKAIGGDPDCAAAININDQASIDAWVNTCSALTVAGLSGTLEIADLAAPGPKALLKRFIALKLLKQSLDNPAVFSGSSVLQPYNENRVTCSIGDPNAPAIEGYKVITGGAACGSTGYLSGSYPAMAGDKIIGWIAGCHDIGVPAVSSEVLAAYAIAVHDPEDILDVQTNICYGSNAGAGGDSATAALAPGFTLVGGGCDALRTTESGKFITGSFPADDGKSWTATIWDYADPATNTILVVYVTGLRSKDPALSFVHNVVGASLAVQSQLMIVNSTKNPVYSGGGYVSHNGWGNLLQGSYPSALNKWTFSSTDLDGHVSQETMVAYAIYLTVTLNMQG
jgi:hypothetical protein